MDAYWHPVLDFFEAGDINGANLYDEESYTPLINDIRTVQISRIRVF